MPVTIIVGTGGFAFIVTVTPVLVAVAGLAHDEEDVITHVITALFAKVLDV